MDNNSGAVGAIRQLIVFAGVGGGVALLYLLVAELGVRLGSAPVTASLISHSLCIPCGYVGQRVLTFGSARPHTVALSRYISLQVFGLVLSTTSAWFCTAVLHLPTTVAFILTALLFTSISYLLQKHWIF